jgi:hypothetical protein
LIQECFLKSLGILRPLRFSRGKYIEFKLMDILLLKFSVSLISSCFSITFKKLIRQLYTLQHLLFQGF